MTINLVSTGNLRKITESGRTVYYSYSTPIGAAVDGKSYANSERYSVTTSRHMGKMYKDMGYPNCEEVTERELRRLLAG